MARRLQEVRDRVRPIIEERCGTMRVLDMTQPVGLGDIYTSVNILEKISGRRGLELAELIREISPEEFERFCLGDVRQKRVPGLEAVEKFAKLMILGKPGAGKTTFLKHLAIQCINGNFQTDKVPVFITLKDFAEADDRPNLLTYIDRFLSSSATNEILQSGKALILLDGLDEVREEDGDRVLRQIKQFSQQFSQNQFVITCRIAAREYIFEQFTEVEVADFDDDQIADFSNKWFSCKNDLVKAERFLQRLKKDKPIRELASSPLLLTLLCLVFEDSGDFPANRSELYENGIDVLLKKWDITRNIDRQQAYKKLSLKRKEDLLSQIAKSTFDAGNYFFKQKDVERQITQYIQNLPDASTDPEALLLDSRAVLKSIESQHGLFVERARGIYSFSHLTFHEYFTARKIVASCNQHDIEDLTLQALVIHLTEKRWREVILLTVGMLEDANSLLSLIKQKTDSLLAGDEKLQQFLSWVHQKSGSVNTKYKPAAVRVHYFAHALVLNSNFTLSLNLIPELLLKREFIRTLDLSLACELDTDQVLNHDLAFDLTLTHAQTLASAFIHDFDLVRMLNRTFKLNYDSTSNLDLALTLSLHFNSTELRQKLQQLKDYTPSFNNIDIEEMRQWWQTNGQAWTEQLRVVMIEHRNIGHDWQFNEQQKKLLQQYYNANKLLVDCLNSDCYVSRDVRQRIEDTLLLPIAEIEKYRPGNS